MAADRTILWIAEQDIADLPDDVSGLKAHGLEIRSCVDLRSFKKLLPAIAIFPDAYIATADDDVYYPPDWLAELVRHLDFSKPVVVSRRAHLARFEETGAAVRYADWEIETRETEARDVRTAIFPTGVGGVLYPPGCLAPDVADSESFLALCPYADDVWFFWMAMLAGTKARQTPGRFDLVTWPSSQEHGLLQKNFYGGRNDEQIRAVEARYGYFQWDKLLS